MTYSCYKPCVFLAVRSENTRLLDESHKYGDPALRTDGWKTTLIHDRPRRWLSPKTTHYRIEFIAIAIDPDPLPASRHTCAITQSPLASSTARSHSTTWASCKSKNCRYAGHALPTPSQRLNATSSKTVLPKDSNNSRKTFSSVNQWPQ